MANINLSDFIRDVSSQALAQSSDYIVNRISEILSFSMKESLDVDTDTSKLAGYAATAAVTVAVEISTSIMATVLSDLGVLEHDGHPHISVVKKSED